MKPITRRLAALLIAAGLATASLAAHAEGQIRIAQQFGIVYLLLNVAQEQKLIEKHAKAAGIDAKVEFLQLSAARLSMTRCCRAASTLRAPASARCSRCGTAPRAARTSRAWPRWATFPTTWSPTIPT